MKVLFAFYKKKRQWEMDNLASTEGRTGCPSKPMSEKKPSVLLPEVPRSPRVYKRDLI